jgi:O-antigen/teichoic acid export membrane protein
MARNVAWGIASQVLSLLLAFFATPVLVRGLGVADYGLWSVSLAIGTWAGFINMVFSTSAIRFIGQAIGGNDASGIRQAYAAIRRWALICGAGTSMALATASPWLAGHVLTVPREQVLTGQALLSLLAFFAFFQIQAAVGHGTISAFQRLDVSYAIRTAGAWLQTGGAAFMVWRHAGILGAAAWMASMQALEALVVHAYAYWRLQEPESPSQAKGLSWIAWGGKFLRYGLPLLGGYLAAQLFLPMSRILIGSVRSLSEVAYFAVPLTIAINVKALSTYVASAVFPAVSQAAGRNDHEGLRRLYLRGLRWSWLAVVPPAGLAMALGQAFITVWISPEFGQAAGPVILPLVLAVNAYYFSAIPEVVAQGIGRPLPWAVLIAVVGLLHVFFGRIWIAQQGAVGAAHALLAAGALLSVGLAAWIGRVLGIKPSSYLQVLDVRLVAATAVVAAAAHWIVAEQTLPVAAILALGMLGLLVIGASGFWWMIPEEREWVSRHWPGRK